MLLRQARDDGPVDLELEDGAPSRAEVALGQAAQIVSLDHDGTGYVALGRRDPVVGERQCASGFLRPVLFHSPYEAAAWAVISTRLRTPIARRVRDALSQRYGGAVEVAGEAMLTFPPPAALEALEHVEGLPEEKVRRLRGVARAAREGSLDRARLRALDPEAARAELLELHGIGPFSADLILLRAVGPTDALSVVEPRGRRAVAAAYGRPELEADEAAYRALADSWRPYRTWVSVLLRAAG